MIIPSTLSTGPPDVWPLSSTLPRLAALVTAPGTVRALVRDILAEWKLDGLAEECVAIASELVANAVAASCSPEDVPVYVGGRMPMVQVCLMSDGVRVLVEVHDQADGRPLLTRVAIDAESGRGLYLIQSLTRGDWGWHSKHPQPGKCVWAVFPPVG